MPSKSLFPALYFLLVFSCLWGVAQRPADVFVRKYSSAELKTDLELMKNIVLRMHPSVGVYASKAYYETLFLNALGQLHDSLTEKEFRIRCKLLADELHCGHTEVMPSREYLKKAGHSRQNYSPYLFMPVEDKLYVIANLNKKTDSTVSKGKEVKSINGIPADSMIRYCRRFINTDGYNKTSKSHFVQSGFNTLFPALFGRPDTFVLEYFENRALKTHAYPAFKVRQLPALPLIRRDDSLYAGSKKKGIRYHIPDSDMHCFVLRLDKFCNAGYKRRYRKIFKSIKRSGTQNLVIDLRNNGGGSIAHTYHLLSYLLREEQTQSLYTTIQAYPYRKYTHGNLYFKITGLVFSMVGQKRVTGDTTFYVCRLKPRKKNHFGGKIMVLINGGSFSASCMLGAYLKTINGVRFIGEESGGAAGGCNAGVTPYYTLPNTGIRLRIPAFRITYDPFAGAIEHGLIPDVQIHYSFRDLAARKDLEMRKVEELLNTSQ
ncbi:MAG TPA: S41 family peptidase [Bacteroidia bacterium]|nr:S41 family peptidase [Bacteroidia bacterium]